MVIFLLIVLLAPIVPILAVLKRNRGRRFEIGSPLRHKYQAIVALIGSAIVAGVMAGLLHDVVQDVRLNVAIATATWLLSFTPSTYVYIRLRMVEDGIEA